MIGSIVVTEESAGTFSSRKASKITYNRQHQARL